MSWTRAWQNHLPALLALIATACAPGGKTLSPRGGETLGVAVSVAPQAYFVERIGGERVDVQVLVPPGSAPTTYDPTPRQITALERARLYVKVGHPDFPFEKKHLDALVARRPGLAVVDMAAGTDFLPFDDDGETDPHIWLSPVAVERTASRIAAALTEIDPASEAFYRENLDTFLADLEALEHELGATFAGLDDRRFLVQHPAWGYFADAYGLEQVAIERHHKEPAPAELVALIDETRRQGFRVVFVQKGISDRSARTVAREIGARVVEVDPLAEDWLGNLRRVAALFKEAASGETPKNG